MFVQLAIDFTPGSQTKKKLIKFKHRRVDRRQLDRLCGVFPIACDYLRYHTLFILWAHTLPD